ncbi:MAG: hypothetical protein JWL85_956 [Candidatus Saccharibacteria bacterium]|nr:hypothetical protein [Candidatus Saccharibacteria bacterium]
MSERLGYPGEAGPDEDLTAKFDQVIQEGFEATDQKPFGAEHMVETIDNGKSTGTDQKVTGAGTSRPHVDG